MPFWVNWPIEMQSQQMSIIQSQKKNSTMTNVKKEKKRDDFFEKEKNQMNKVFRFANQFHVQQ